MNCTGDIKSLTRDKTLIKFLDLNQLHYETRPKFHAVILPERD